MNIHTAVFKITPSFHLLQGPMGKQGIQGLLGVDGPPVSYNRYTSTSVSVSMHMWLRSLFKHATWNKSSSVIQKYSEFRHDSIQFSMLNIFSACTHVCLLTREILNLIKCNWMNRVCQLTFYVVFLFFIFSPEAFPELIRSRLTFKMRTTDLLTWRLFSSQGINFSVESNTFVWVSHRALHIVLQSFVSQWYLKVLLHSVTLFSFVNCIQKILSGRDMKKVHL